MSESTLPTSANLGYFEELLAQFESDPASVPEEWRTYFQALNISPKNNGAANGAGKQGGKPPGANGTARAGAKPANGKSPKPAATVSNSKGQTAPAPANLPDFEALLAQAFPYIGRPAVKDETEGTIAVLQERVGQLIHAHRVRGHMIAHLDPLDLPRPYPMELDPEFYGFTAEDMEHHFSCETLHHEGRTTLREILEIVRSTYCRSIGVQFTHIDDLEVRRWLQERMESTENHCQLNREEQVRILTRLTDAVTFEEFIRRKFVGAKSFSLEGAESLIPLLDLAIERAAEHGIEEIVMGMAHRGRLNVLANIIGKSPREIFREFEDKDADLHIGGGDVKYHLGYVNDFETSIGKKVHLALCFNPSHLEFVNPVALGRTRAKQDRNRDYRREKSMCLLIHGDAAFAGEGIIQETLNMSQLRGYAIGGTLHVVVNNQIGFTTSPSESRSTAYATDVAKMLQIPIFHVNGEDPEAVAQVVHLAMDFRQEFNRDVVIDMYCYRRLGHNETDEPSFTQPQMYRAIAARKPVREAYLDRLLEMGGLTREEADEINERRRQHLEKELSEARNATYRPPDKMRIAWGGYVGGPEQGVREADTAVPKERLQTLMRLLTQLPEDFHANPRVKRILAARAAMAEGNQPLDWASAEALAFASLVTQGVPVRLSGQDSERGTFSQRHAVLHDIEDDHVYTPLLNLAADQAPLEIHNSPLSETGVMGFEYGYSLDCLVGLVAWEAQFGDFWNVAQPIVDQFICSAEDKWNHLSGIVLLLPHGFEGMGPEHSSARLERFMSLAAEDNIQITNPTTPAQYFHLLRRQVLRKWRKPLIVMTPKSLLRHLEAVSTLDELTTGTFQKVIPDRLGKNGDEVKRILLCSGKIYYELDQAREKLGRDDVAILRLEQLYPFPEQELRAAMAQYSDETPLLWVQEEPMNMGAWRHMRVWLGQEAFDRLPFWGVYRPASASPATGSASAHKREQERIIVEAFGG